MRAAVSRTVGCVARGVCVTPPARFSSRLGRVAAHVLVLGGTCRARLETAHAFHRQRSPDSRTLVRVDGRREEERLVLALNAWASLAPATRDADLLRAAEGGTLFVDAVADLSMPAQNALLDFACGLASEPWSEREPRWRGRLIAGDRQHLGAAVRQGRFSAALYDVLDKVRVELDGSTASWWLGRTPGLLPLDHETLLGQAS